MQAPRQRSWLILFSIFSFVVLMSRTTERKNSLRYTNQHIEIRGIYGSPEPFWKKGLRLDELGVNAVFMHDASITDSIMRRAKAEDQKVFAEFATLNGKGYVDKHPEAWPIDKDGRKAAPATWFMGACPTELGFRQYRLNALKNLLSRFDVDGVWMDYLHWHAQFEDAEPLLPETCFCENCISQFENYKAIKVPGTLTAIRANWILSNHDSAWRNWRCQVIAGWVKDFRAVLKKQKPGALLGVYHCPWSDSDHNGARRKNLGLDYDLLRDIVDVFSPMVYHGRMGREPQWVKENISWFSAKLKARPATFPKVWPIVQCYNDPVVISPGEFESVLRYGATRGSTGVMMFTSHAVAADENKIQTMKKVYLEWKNDR